MKKVIISDGGDEQSSILQKNKLESIDRQIVKIKYEGTAKCSHTVKPKNHYSFNEVFENLGKELRTINLN